MELQSLLDSLIAHRFPGRESKVQCYTEQWKLFGIVRIWIWLLSKWTNPFINRYQVSSSKPQQLHNSHERTFKVSTGCQTGAHGHFPTKNSPHLFISLTPKLWSSFPGLISLKYLHFIRLFWFPAVAIDRPSLYMWFDTKLSALLQCYSLCGSASTTERESLTSNTGLFE